MKDNGMTAQFAGEVERAVSGPKPSVGRIVHYTAKPNGEHWAAMITSVDEQGYVTLAMFPPGDDPYSPTGRYAHKFAQGEPGDLGMWHWPEQV